MIIRQSSPSIPSLGTLGTEVGPVCIWVCLSFVKWVSTPELVT